MIGIEAAFTGRIGKTPQMKTSKAGRPWCTFSVAVDDAERDDADNAQATWVSIAAFGETAENIVTFEKGTRVYCEGTLRLSSWSGQDGAERTGLQLAARVVQPMGVIGRQRPPKSKATTGKGGTEARRNWQAPPDAAPGGPDSEIPF